MYQLPDDKTLGKWLYILQQALIRARLNGYETDQETADVMDALHNLPDLLLRWPDAEEKWLIEDLKEVERKHPRLKGMFTRPLEDGPPPHWPPTWPKKS